MHQVDVARLLNLSGLFLGFVGTVIVWRYSAPVAGSVPFYASGGVPGGGPIIEEMRAKAPKVRLNLRVGLALLAAGFALQFVAELV